MSSWLKVKQLYPGFQNCTRAQIKGSRKRSQPDLTLADCPLLPFESFLTIVSNENECLYPDGKFSTPSACTLHGCKSRTFKQIRSSAQAIDFQKIRLQELLKSEDHEEGRVPRTVECELTEDLVDVCIPGDVVTVTGIIRVINNYMDIGGGKFKGRNQGFYYLYIEAVFVKNSKLLSMTEDLEDSNSDARPTELVDLFSFSPMDLEFIVKFREEHGSDVFRQILQSRMQRVTRTAAKSLYRGRNHGRGTFF
ncbi:probable DNA helicase MCM8 [Hibiscus syriacus]|uniref:probable DNA helicase MCM8 n=1 Tax=Hibiscus syriacus TaxID=106335 RepID=UPI001924C574|nr:probable DNA helicase MCM8 [Hibiscus syriacus]